ncbi:MAG: aminotransferase class I/II-fold pyridoxal phosphate-dependent enzyme [Ignavibacteriales bacterium]|nr:MAG: aminotransferase class I/II-fold pyridoxal phosphate-dependent enzyme [Ignavibacteriales bacterium]
MINSKLPNIGSSIFAVMTKMALDHNAINLSQGFPDFNCPDELLNLVKKYQEDGYNQYAPMPGISVLREKLSKKIKSLYGRNYNPETEITITAGATEAIFSAITASIQKDDEVILLEPAYDSYAPSVMINGGIPLFIPLTGENYKIDWDRVKDNISARTKMIIINSPHNPTGSVINRTDIRILEELTRNTGILILSDEVYEHITFDGEKHFSLSLSEELSKRSFIIFSFGKTYHTTGWKVGYCAAPENLSKELRKVHQFIVFSVNTPVQYAYADFLDNEKHFLSLNNFYQRKRDLVLNLLKDTYFNFTPAKGTYFQLLDYSKISDMDDMTFSKILTKDFGIATIPLSPFYSNEYNDKIIRICFAKKDEVLEEGMRRLINASEEIKNLKVKK